MKYVLGVDLSEYQDPNLPWPLWKVFGVVWAILRASVGYVGDGGYDKHREHAHASGVDTGLYCALLNHDSETDHFDGARTAQNFWRMHEPGDELPFEIEGRIFPRSWVDVEALGLSARLLSEFLAEFHRIAPGVLIGIYTSKYVWQMMNGTGLIGRGHTEFAGYDYWIADYTNNPPLLPDTCREPVIHQYRSKRGILPGYDRDLDLNRLYIPERTAFQTLEAARTQLGVADRALEKALSLV